MGTTRGLLKRYVKRAGFAPLPQRSNTTPEISCARAAANPRISFLFRERRREERTIGQLPARRLGVHPHAVLRPTRPDERPSSRVLGDDEVNNALQARRRLDLPLGVGRAERMAVLHKDLDEPVREVDVRLIPFERTPRAMKEDRLDEEHVREGVSDSLVDELGDGEQVGEAGLVRGRGRRGGRDEGRRFAREEDGSVPVGFKVDANVVGRCRVVEVLDAGRDAGDWDVLQVQRC